MAAITAGDVAKLRAATGAGLMDCKQALSEAGGDFEKAVDLLRKRGKQIAEKKAERETRTGAIAQHIDAAGGVGALIELKCETDFVARNEEFRKAAQDLARHVASARAAASAAEVLGQPFVDDPSRTVQEIAQAVSGKTGENVQLTRAARFERGPGALFSYIHSNANPGVLIELRCEVEGALSGEEAQAVGKDLCMHVAFHNPLALDRDQVPADVVARERAIHSESDAIKGKPANVIQKIIDGKMGAFFKERCLIDQPFVRDTTKSVRQVLGELGDKVGAPVEVARFVRFELGEAAK